MKTQAGLQNGRSFSKVSLLLGASDPKKYSPVYLTIIFTIFFLLPTSTLYFITRKHKTVPPPSANPISHKLSTLIPNLSRAPSAIQRPFMSAPVSDDPGAPFQDNNGGPNFTNSCWRVYCWRWHRGNQIAGRGFPCINGIIPRAC